MQSFQEQFNVLNCKLADLNERVFTMLIQDSYDYRLAITNKEYTDINKLINGVIGFLDQQDFNSPDCNYKLEKSSIENDKKVYELCQINVKSFSKKIIDLLCKEEISDFFFEKFLKYQNYVIIFINFLSKIFSSSPHSLNNQQQLSQQEIEICKIYVLVRDNFFKQYTERLNPIIFNRLINLITNKQKVDEYMRQVFKFYDQMNFLSGKRITIDNNSVFNGIANLSKILQFQDVPVFQFNNLYKFINLKLKEYYTERFSNQWEHLTLQEYVQVSSQDITQWRQVLNDLNAHPYLFEKIKFYIISGAENNGQKLRFQKFSEQTQGLSKFLEQNEKDKLKQYYDLIIQYQKFDDKEKSFSNPTISYFADQYFKFIQQQILKIQKEQTLNPLKKVEATLNLKQESDNLLFDYLNKDMVMIKSRDNAFINALKEVNQFELYYSQFLDLTVKTGLKGLQDIEKENKVENCLKLVNYLYQKDKFLSVYQHYYKQRVLDNKGQDDEVEKQIISRLKQLLGTSLCQKLEKLRLEFEQSLEEMKKFKVWPKKRFFDNYQNVEISLKVISQINWPDSESLNQLQHIQDSFHSKVFVHLPQIDYFIQDFKTFFCNNESKNILLPFQDDEITVDVKFDKKYQIIGSAKQILVLMQFNDKSNESFSCSQLIELTKISFQDLELILEGFVNFKLLIKSENSFKLNYGFTHKQNKINKDLFTIKKKNPQKTKQEMDNIDKQIILQREFELDAMIMRIMKAHKTVIYQQLESLVLNGIKTFTPQPSSIKARFEGLIEKDYIARDDKNTKLFHYIP